MKKNNLIKIKNTNIINIKISKFYKNNFMKSFLNKK